MKNFLLVFCIIALTNLLNACTVLAIADAVGSAVVGTTSAVIGAVIPDGDDDDDD